MLNYCLKGGNKAAQYAVRNTKRAKGSRNKATLANECLLHGQAKALTWTVVTKASEDGFGFGLRLQMGWTTPIFFDDPGPLNLTKTQNRMGYQMLR